MPLQPMITGARHMISAGHYLATEAGHAVLEAGGNAVDAGVAAGIALGVVHSDQVQCSGVAPMIIYLAERDEAVVISGLGGWPRAARLEAFLGEHGGVIPLGILRTVVPAAPDAWILALERYGTMSFGDVAGAAIRYAREGFTMHPVMAHYIAKNAETYRRWPDNAAIYLPQGRAPREGELFVQADLARSLQFMVDEERAASRGGRIAGLRAARDAFYRGDLAAAMVRYHAEHGGWLTARDLEDVPFRDRAPALDQLPRRRGALLRPVVPGAGPAPDAVPARRRRSRRARPQYPGLRPSRRRGHEALLRRPRALLRRPALRARADGRAARAVLRRRAPAPRAAGDGVGRDAAGRRRPGIRPAGRSGEPTAVALGARRGEPRAARRHVLCLRRRPARQCAVRHAERRLLGEPGDPRPRLLSLVARVAVLGGARPSLVRGARQAAAAHAESGDGPATRPMGDAVRRAGGRSPAASHAPGLSQSHRVRDERAGGGGGPALRHAQLSGQLRAASVSPGPARPRAGNRGNRRRGRSRPAATESSGSPISPSGRPASARSRPTASEACSTAEPTRAAPPAPWAGEARGSAARIAPKAPGPHCSGTRIPWSSGGRGGGRGDGSV